MSFYCRKHVAGLIPAYFYGTKRFIMVYIQNGGHLNGVEIIIVTELTFMSRGLIIRFLQFYWRLETAHY